MKPPTQRQLEVLAAIWSHQRVHGRAPTIRELGAFLGGIGNNATVDHLKALEAKGLIASREVATARAIRLTSEGLAALDVRLCPSCGQPAPLAAYAASAAYAADAAYAANRQDRVAS